MSVSQRSIELSSHLEDLDRDGYTVLEDLFDEELRNNLKAALDRLMAEPPQEVLEFLEWMRKRGMPTDAFNCMNLAEHAQDAVMPAVMHPVLLEIAEAMMGPSVQLDACRLARWPGVPRDEAGSRVSGWHRDRYGGMLGDDFAHKPLALAAINYLQDLTDETGPLRVIPGSHRRGMFMPAEERTLPHPDEVLIHMRAGDVVVTRAGVVHTGTVNISTQPRLFFSVYYNHAWMRHGDDHSGPNVQALIEKARAAGDRRLMRMLGVNVDGDSRVNSGFMDPLAEQWQKWKAEDQASG